MGGNLIVALLVLLIGAVAWDLSATRIPNALVLSGLIIGVFYRVLCMGERNYLAILLGIMIPVLLFFPLFLIRAMGAGDIKLFAVTGTFFTIGENLKCIVLAIMIGGVFALIKVLFYKNLRERLKYMFAYFRKLLRFACAGSFQEFAYIDRGESEKVKRAGIKFSLPILIAAIIVMGDML